MKIADIMTRNVKTTKPHTSIQEAAALMEKIDSGALLVHDGDRLVGIVSLGNISDSRSTKACATVMQGVARAH